MPSCFADGCRLDTLLVEAAGSYSSFELIRLKGNCGSTFVGTSFDLIRLIWYIDFFACYSNFTRCAITPLSSLLLSLIVNTQSSVIWCTVQYNELHTQKGSIIFTTMAEFY